MADDRPTYPQRRPVEDGHDWLVRLWAYMDDWRETRIGEAIEAAFRRRRQRDNDDDTRPTRRRP